jgi:hypothetical protein
MDIIIGILFLLIWIGIGYAVFYFRYGDRELVNDLRKNTSQLQLELDTIAMDTKEFEQQNRILKEKMGELLMKNEDLTKISSELYRYYYRIKESHTKALELVDLLQSFDKEFDEKIKINEDTRTIPIQTINSADIKRF